MLTRVHVVLPRGGSRRGRGGRAPPPREKKKVWHWSAFARLLVTWHAAGGCTKAAAGQRPNQRTARRQLYRFRRLYYPCLAWDWSRRAKFLLGLFVEVLTSRQACVWLSKWGHLRPHEGGNFDGEVSPRQDSCSLKEEVKNGHFVREKTSGFQNFPRPRWGHPPEPQLVLSRAMHAPSRFARPFIFLFSIWRPLLTEILDPPVLPQCTNKTMMYMHTPP